MTEYVPRLRPWKHQAEALAKLEGRKFFALLMAMRTGKTKVVLDDFGRLELGGEIDDLLVIAPAGVYRTWETSVEDHASRDLLGRLKLLVWKSGDKGSQKAKERLRTFLEGRTSPRMLLMNVEALSSVQEARQVALLFASQRRTMIVVDESTVIKNSQSKRGRFVIKELAPRGSMRRILSGLPTPRSPLDLYGQFEFLEKQLLGFTTFYGFRNRYAVLRRMKLKNHSFDMVVGYRDVEDLQRRIKPHSHRVTLEDCYDLPPKMYSMRDVEMTEEQARIYREVRDKATSELEAMAHVTATSVVSRMLRCHQVLCGHVRDEHGVLHHVPERRTEELLCLLEEHEGKAIIWCSYDYNVNRIAEAIQYHFGEKEVTARFWGGNLNTREEEEKRFKEDPRCRYMIATPGAGGRGRTWVDADLVVYFSNVDNLEHRNQSEERAQGIDKVRSVGYVDLVARGTVDERIIKALRRKLDMAATITGDNWREWLI